MNAHSFCPHVYAYHLRLLTLFCTNTRVMVSYEIHGKLWTVD